MSNKPMFTQPKQKRSRQRVDAILNAASELFAEVGYEAATIVEIAARSNTAVGSMYQFFANKEAILYAIVERYVAAATEVFANIQVESYPDMSLEQYAPALPDSYIEESYSVGFGSTKVRKTILRMYRERNPQKDFAGWDEKSKSLMQQKPSMVLWGDRDPFADSTFADKFGAQQVVHFKDYSHWLPLEAPDAYAEKLIPWLASA